VSDNELKSRLDAILGEIIKCDTHYRSAGRKAELFKLPAHDNVGNVRCDEMIKVYTGRMAKGNTSGRHYYDKLIARAPQGRCPLCGQRTVSTLDHYLPKAGYPSFVVTPHNLIPACKDCNKEKSDVLADSADEQTLHPYFDDIDRFVWLKSVIVHSSPAAAQFFVDTSGVPAKMAKRAEYHFKRLKLGPLYASHAADEIAGISYRLCHLLGFGAATVKIHLEAEATSRVVARRNSWQSALYTAMASDDWFCQGGCRM
jgi:5-methylcytosine-specific restriction endonuclease McrA